MNLQWIFDLLNYVIDKEQIGNAISATEFNTLLPSVQWELVNAELDKLVKDALTPIAGVMVSGSILNPFKKTAQLNPVDGSVAIPTDYVRFMSFGQFGFNTDTVTVANQFREITPVTPDQFVKIQNNIYARPDIHPVVKILDQFYFLPNDIPLVNLDYIRVPKTPYYDYCQDATTGNAIYMPVGSYLVDTGTQINLVIDNPSIGATVILYSGVYNDPAKSYPYNSLTVELEWEQRAYEDLVLRLLSRAGVNLSAEGITQYAEAKLKEQA